MQIGTSPSNVKAHANVERNQKTFDEIVRLFRDRTPIPDDREWPLTQPKLSDYSFPAHILGEVRLTASLAEPRVRAIREAIAGRPGAVSVAYRAPWSDPSIIEPGSVDFFISQAVLEHVEDLETTYAAMCSWMKPGACMSHSIDFSCHDLTRSWNGHWAVGDFTWRIVRGTRRYLINRHPLSVHLALLAKNRFEPVLVERRQGETGTGFRPARMFECLSAEDLSTRGAFVQAKVRQP